MIESIGNSLNIKVNSILRSRYESNKLTEHIDEEAKLFSSIGYDLSHILFKLLDEDVYLAFNDDDLLLDELNVHIGDDRLIRYRYPIEVDDEVFSKIINKKIMENILFNILLGSKIRTSLKSLKDSRLFTIQGTVSTN